MALPPGVGAGRETVSPWLPVRCHDQVYLLVGVGMAWWGVAQVRLVRLKETGEVFAMKSLIKEAMNVKNQVRGYQRCRWVADLPQGP